MVHKPSALVHKPSALVHKPSALVHKPSALVHMKNKQLRLRMPERRFYKLHLCAVQSDKTMTQIIEEVTYSHTE
ncbi:hypothetical protein B4U84_12305 [Westiellopsis prolifica IICB1]|nr:hypothetical protein B4U84_12305 [Westiellopsis prolifica IICB1]